MFGDQDFVAHYSRDIQLFSQFTNQARLVVFVRLTFTTGKLPVTCEVSVLQSSGQQEPALAFDHARKDDDRPMVIGHGGSRWRKCGS